MYERSAIVLERHMEKILEFNKPYNLKKNAEDYEELIHEIESYRIMMEKEQKVIQEFDIAAKKIETLQKEQEKLSNSNRKLEDDRAQLFADLGEESKTLDIKLQKIEKTVDKNNERLQEIREEFVQYLADFSEKQKDRNRCEKIRRIGERKHVEYIERLHGEFADIDTKDITTLKSFITAPKEEMQKAALNIMTKNGKNEKVAFNQDVLKKAIEVRTDIAVKEAECYIAIYDKMKKLLAEVDNEDIRLHKYKKTLRDTSVKLAFFDAEKEYIVSFLDYERMTAISGKRMHNKKMAEACENFDADIAQIGNLYELILKETANRAPKKAYRELYNKTYLQDIEDKEKNFEQEVNQANISMGTVINSNYWRIEGIKNIYRVFQEEVTAKFEKDMAEFRIAELDREINEDDELEERRYGNLKSPYGYNLDDEELDKLEEEYNKKAKNNKKEEVYEEEEEDIEEEYEEDEEEYDDFEEEAQELAELEDEEDYEDYEDDEEDEDDDYEEFEDFDDYEDDYEDFDDGLAVKKSNKGTKYEEDYEEEQENIEVNNYQEEDYEDDEEDEENYSDYEEDFDEENEEDYNDYDDEYDYEEEQVYAKEVADTIDTPNVYAKEQINLGNDRMYAKNQINYNNTNYNEYDSQDIETNMIQGEDDGYQAQLGIQDELDENNRRIRRIKRNKNKLQTNSDDGEFQDIYRSIIYNTEEATNQQNEQNNIATSQQLKGNRVYDENDSIDMVIEKSRKATAAEPKPKAKGGILQWFWK